METSDILVEAFGRVRGLVHQAASGLHRPQLTFRPELEANSIAWLIWHLTRIQDDHVSKIAEVEQVWVTGSYAAELGLAPDPDALGQGDGPDDVAAISPGDASPLLRYHDEVMDRTVVYLNSVTAAELDRIIDHSYSPPVSVGVRLVSVLSDNLQHAGQARFLRGMVDRSG